MPITGNKPISHSLTKELIMRSFFTFLRLRTMAKLSLILVAFILIFVLMLFVASVLLQHNVSISHADDFFKNHQLGFFFVRMIVLGILALSCAYYVRAKTSLSSLKDSTERAQKIKRWLGNPVAWFVGFLLIDVLLNFPAWLS